ncbi:MAG: hypothetical protein HY432_03085 [Candidatus Liptonbacteria bacterium]|nr:hypothetical protein [Candidatus Liptonbacteria bacterium]
MTRILKIGARIALVCITGLVGGTVAGILIILLSLTTTAVRAEEARALVDSPSCWMNGIGFAKKECEIAEKAMKGETVSFSDMSARFALDSKCRELGGRVDEDNGRRETFFKADGYVCLKNKKEVLPYPARELKQGLGNYHHYKAPAGSRNTARAWR